MALNQKILDLRGRCIQVMALRREGKEIPQDLEPSLDEMREALELLRVSRTESAAKPARKKTSTKSTQTVEDLGKLLFS